MLGAKFFVLWTIALIVYATGVLATIQCTIVTPYRTYCVIPHACVNEKEFVFPESEVECDYREGLLKLRGDTCEEAFNDVMSFYDRRWSMSSAPANTSNPNLPLSLMVPTYKWMQNIFHFGRAIGVVTNVLWNLMPGIPLPKHLIFLEPKKTYTLGDWHLGLASALAAYGNLQITDITSNYRKGFQCFESLILPGNDYGFMFQNRTRPVVTWREVQTTTHIPSVPSDALRFRDMIGHAVGAKQMRFAVDWRTKTYAVAPPPKLIAINKRTASSTRDLSDGKRLDEIVAKLAKKYSFQVKHQAFENKSFKDQVNMMNNVGIVTGLHGANLVNSLFMPPMGSLVEILPRCYRIFTYMAGSNSGLQYTFIESDDESVKCCGLEDVSCQEYLRSRMINLSDERWALLEAAIEKAMIYVSVLSELKAVDLVRVGEEFHVTRNVRMAIFDAWRNAELLKEEEIQEPLGHPDNVIFEPGRTIKNRDFSLAAP